MTNRTQSGFLALVLAMGLTGCEGASPVSPSLSSLTAPPPPASSPSVGDSDADCVH